MTTRTKPIYVCNPPPPRCRKPIDPTFDAGISVRHSPSCTGTICGLFACDGGNWRVTNNGTLDRSKWIEGWIISQLFTRGEVDCNEHPLGKRDGGWWADSFRNLSADSRVKEGFKLWAVKWAPMGNATLVTAEAFAHEGVALLINWGVPSKLKIPPVYVRRHNQHLPNKLGGSWIASTFPL